MRTLNFIIDAQTIRPDPSCDFSGIVRGTKGYLQAEFYFSVEWNGCRKAAVFTKLGKEYPVPIINNRCEIPEEVLTRNTFTVSVVGTRDDYRITTNKTEVRQDG